MTVTKNTPLNGSMAEVGAYASQLVAFAGGQVFIGKGSYADRAAFATKVADLTVMATELGTAFDELADVAEKPGKIESKVAELKTKHHISDGKRTNTIELHLAGISEARKAFLENDLNKSDQTIILVDENGNRVICFNGLRWSGSYSGEIDGVFDAVLKTEFSGSSVNKIWIADNIPAGA